MKTTRPRCGAIAGILIALAAFVALTGCGDSTTGPTATRPDSLTFPHFALTNTSVCRALEKFEAFVKIHQDKGYIAVFDFDATISSGAVDISADYAGGGARSYQSSWHIWGAVHRADGAAAALRIFPYLVTDEGATDVLENIVTRDDYLENRRRYTTGTADVNVDEYCKYSQIATFEAGMTPLQMRSAVSGFLSRYPVARYAFPQTLDIMQVLADAGFKIWIVTASNPYFISVVVRAIEASMKYRADRNYSFGIVTTLPFNPDSCRIAGNCAALAPDSTFSMVYNDRYVNGAGDGRLRVVDNEGKKVAVQKYIEAREGAPVVLVCGDSGGDNAMMAYVLAKTDVATFGIGINPNDALQNTLRSYASKTTAFAAAPAP